MKNNEQKSKMLWKCFRNSLQVFVLRSRAYQFHNIFLSLRRASDQVRWSYQTDILENGSCKVMLKIKSSPICQSAHPYNYLLPPSQIVCTKGLVIFTFYHDLISLQYVLKDISKNMILFRIRMTAGTTPGLFLYEKGLKWWWTTTSRSVL